MTVYVVFHSDIEDDKYVRGVFATRELADQVTTMDEQCGDLVRQHKGFPNGESLCCFVEAYEVATEAPYVQYGPPKPWDLNMTSNGLLIPKHVEKTLMDLFEMWGPTRT